MFLLVKCKRHLQDRGVTTYGELAYRIWGWKSWALVDIMLMMCQMGVCVAYTIFIGENLHSMYPGLTSIEWMWIITPAFVLLANLRTLKQLGPYAFVATIVMYLVLCFIFAYDIAMMAAKPVVIKQANYWGASFSQIITFCGIGLYSLEGVGTIIPIEHNMKDPKAFPKVLYRGFTVSAVTFILFGIAGYLAFGANTKDVITLNLPGDALDIVTKFAIIFVMLATYPLQLYPVSELLEKRFVLNATNMHSAATEFKRTVVRTVLVCLITFIGNLLPHFGIIISLIGATSGTILSFVLPSLFHLKLFRTEMPRWKIAKDITLIVVGIFMVITGTIISIQNIQVRHLHRSAKLTPVTTHSHL
eukprot:TRINITY_DN1012_c0_g2_i1.p1 TRINITY_DN1012_c0_g2~~TRINITY_DN1012_c0_g2_i1.p1  ORF type:complete len:360 (+),score=84.72 TRINITY_DN1012_c0_g2_i1:773-1852(+)